MFVYSLRASTLKLFAVMLVSLACILCLALFVPSYGEAATAGGTTVYEGIRTEADRTALLSRLGYTVKGEAIEEVSFTLPEEFDSALAGYNELQKSQGLDLSKYKKKDVTRYTFAVTNYDGYDGAVYANVLTYRGRVIGGDICSADVSGFIHGFEKPAGE